jgi:hypothetical protein
MLLCGPVRAQDDPNAGAQCGNTIVEVGEECDPPGSTSAGCVVGERCGPTCRCEPVLDHFKCYRAIQKAQTSLFHRVPLADRFETGDALIKKVRHFCNATGANGEGIADPTHHLACYSLRELVNDGVGGERRKQVVIENEFGQWQVRLKRRSELCVPTSTSVGAPLPDFDHYKCYWVRYFWNSSPLIRVDLEDEFETKAANLLKPRRVCNPVDEDGQGILNSADHLACYELEEGHPRYIGDVRTKQIPIENPYDQGDLLVSAKYRKQLCIRSSIVEIPTP